MAYSEFFVTKGAGASDLNGGGPRLGANDAPIAVCTDATIAGGALTTIVDNTAGNWAGVAVDDFLCWDTAGVKEMRRVSALAPGGDATKITIASAATAGANKDVHIGGAWTTVDFMMSTVTKDTVNAALVSPRGNIKYSATAYSEQATVDNAGAYPGYLITYEGFETTPGDDCPNGNLPLISSSATGITGGIVCAKNAIVIKNLRVEMTGAGIHAINAASAYARFQNLRLKATGAAANGFVNNGQSFQAENVYVEDSAQDGFSLAGGTLIACRSSSAGRYGFYSAGGGNILSAIGCIVDSPADDGFYVSSYPTDIVGCTVHGSVAGSGVRFTLPYGALASNCIFAANNQYGIECDSAQISAPEDFNAFYSNGVNETYRMTPNAGAAVHVGLHSVTLTGDPFTNAAGGDFSLNATAGAGAACRSTGFPGTLLDGVNIGYADIGALQHADPASVPGGAHILGGFIVR